METIAFMINELVSKKIFSREEIAVKMRVTAMAVYYWQRAKSKPSFIESGFIEKLYSDNVKKGKVK